MSRKAEADADIDQTRTLRELLAREHVREARARYAWHAARAEREELIALYAPDGVFEAVVEGARKAFRGHAQLREVLAGMTRPCIVIPLIHNHVILFNDDVSEAWGTCAMESRSGQEGAGDFAGYYHDRLVLRGGAWLFAERRWFTYRPDYDDSGLGPDNGPRDGQ